MFELGLHPSRLHLVMGLEKGLGREPGAVELRVLKIYELGFSSIVSLSLFSFPGVLKPSIHVLGDHLTGHPLLCLLSKDLRC